MITIIAVLAALSTAGIMRAMNTARQTGMKTELDNLDAALKSYKEKYGSYPPCNLAIQHMNPDINKAANAAVYSHVARAFPRYNINNLLNDLKAAGMYVDVFRPDQALVFWLRGFGPDVTNPFVTVDGRQIINGTPQGMPGSIKTTPFFDFDQGRLCTKVPNYVPAYFPRGAKITTLAGTPYPSWTSGAGPYVYWDGASYKLPGGTNAYDPFAFNTTSTLQYEDAGTAVPYWNDSNGNRTANLPADSNETWANPDSFQIIATGLDGKYGLPITMSPAPSRLYPSGFNYDPAGTDDDNISNFCDRARMGDARP